MVSVVMPTSIEEAVISLIGRMNASMPDIGLFKLPPDFEDDLATFEDFEPTRPSTPGA